MRHSGIGGGVGSGFILFEAGEMDYSDRMQALMLLAAPSFF